MVSSSEPLPDASGVPVALDEASVTFVNADRPLVFPRVTVTIEGTDVIFATTITDLFLMERDITLERIKGIIGELAQVDSFQWERDEACRVTTFYGVRNLIKAFDEVVLRIPKRPVGEPS